MAVTISGTDGIVGAGFTVDNSGVSVTAGVGTFGSIGAGTSVAAAGLHGAMPTIDGSALTSINAAQLVGVCTAGLTRSGGFGGGKTLQVQQTVKTDTASATTENSWEDISGMSVSITPSNSSNKIRVTAVCNINCSHGTYWAVRVVKDGSIFGAEGGASGSRTRCFGGHYDTENNYSLHCTVVDFLDTAGGTSAITYKLQWYNPYGSSTRYINRSVTSEDGDYRFLTASTITATEIEA